MTETPRRRRRTEATARKRVQRITRKLSDSLGNDFFQSAVKHIADALEANCVYLGELIDGPVKLIHPLAVCLNREFAVGFEQDLPGTAFAYVIAEGSLVNTRDVAQLFPLDRTLERLRAQAFVGYRLSDSDGQVMGVLAAVYSERLEDLELVKSVLEAFTPKVAVELERKREHESLRRADERHRAFIASSMDAMWRVELEKPIPVQLDEEEQVERIYRYGYLAECNEALARLTGAPSVEDLIGARFGTLVPQDNIQLLEELRSAIRSGYRGTVVQTTPLDALGRRMYRLRSQFGIVEHGELLRLWGTTRDITELKRAELALEASERRCHEILERLQLPAVVVDLTGKVVFANDALLRLCGWSKQVLTTGNWFDLMADQETRDNWKAALIYAGYGPTSAHLEGPLECAEGIQRLISWDTTLLLDADGGVEAIAAIGTDITSQKAVEAQIRQAQKLEGIRRLAAAVAHDFNNLLTVIVGHTSRLLGGISETNAMRDDLSTIRDSSMQCVGLTEQLLAIGRQQRLQLVVFNLNSTITGAEAVIRGLVGEKVRLDLRLDSSLRLVKADPAQIERVLANMAANARDAMPSGGELIIATANTELDEASVSSKPGLKSGPYVRLTLTDTGVGMSEEVRSRIFDPFFTTKAAGQGTGLGLSTVYGIIGQSEGFISVSSLPGQGTSFEILLPAAEAIDQPNAGAK